MPGSKRYYWLKLNENFFEREEIRIIENMPNGKDYIIFYMKLLLKTVSTEGKLIFRDVIPYTPEMLSSITNTDVDTVRVATDLFVKLGLMEIWDDGTLFMVEVQNMVGSETGWAKKKRIQRDKKDNVPIKEDNVPKLSGECPTDIDIEIDIEKEKEKDIEKDIDTTSTTLTQKTINQIIEEWNKLGLQQLRGINNNTNRHSMLKARIKEYSLDDVIQAIRNIDESSFLKGQNKRGWTITFDWLIRPNNFIKVLENNYKDKEAKNGFYSSTNDDREKGRGETYDYDKFFD